jgi:pyruvate kinase
MRSTQRGTKIVATLGPASADESILTELISAGVDVVRINSSHGSPDIWTEWIEGVRKVSDAADRHVGVLLDLQGPRIRVGSLSVPRKLETGAEVVFAPEQNASGTEIPTTYEALSKDVEPGRLILLDDGLLCVEVTGVRADRVAGLVRHGGKLSSNKGMNLPGSEVSAPTLTDVDRKHLQTAVEHGVEFVGISFVRCAEDVETVRSLVPAETALVAKIETTPAVDDLERILAAADAVMVARGDLGVELPFEKVPITQKRLIAAANCKACPVITATQMLDSMIRHPRPTRAEASDVANAILDGTDAVMLSGETAVGAYPIESVRALARIIEEVERTAPASRTTRRSDLAERGESGEAANAIAYATTVAAEMLDAPFIVCLTKSGFTARQIAAFRPSTPILGLSPEVSTCRTLSLVWGVTPILAQGTPTYDSVLGQARHLLSERRLVKSGDNIAVTAGVPFHVAGTTNLLKVESI